VRKCAPGNITTLSGPLSGENMSRHRSSSGQYPSSITSSRQGYGISISPDGHPGCTSGYSDKQDIDDEVSPPGARPYNAVSHTRHSASIIHDQSHDVMVTDEPYIDRWTVNRFGLIPAWNPVSTVDIPWADMVASLSDKVSDVCATKSQLAVSIAELDKTLRMLRNPFALLTTLRTHRIVRGYDDARVSLFELSKSLSGKYLEFRYGFTPLWLDLKNFTNSFVKLYEVCSPDRFEGSIAPRYSIKRDLVPSTPPPTTSDAGFLGYCTQNAWSSTAGGFARLVFSEPRTTAIVSCDRLRREYAPVNWAYRTLEVLGCTPNDLLDVLWELTPYSFVIDWFVDSHRFLRPDPRLAFASEFISRVGHSVKTEVQYRAELVLGVPYPGNYPSGITQFGLPRQYVGEWGKSTFYTRTPGLPADEGILNARGLSILHSTDALGLILQRLVVNR